MAKKNRDEEILKSEGLDLESEYKNATGFQRIFLDAERRRAADVLTGIIRAVGHQLDADESIDIAGVLHVDIGFHFTVKFFLHFTGDFGGIKCVHEGAIFVDEPCDGTADGQRKEHDRGEEHCCRSASAAGGGGFRFK